MARCRGIVLAIVILLFPSVVLAQQFSDQTNPLGAAFLHHTPPSEPMLMGAGAAFGDYDGDGDLDLYVCDRLGANKLLQNQGGGAGFVNVAVATGLDLPADDSTGALFGDYDNDGDQDLYVMNRGDNRMFRNDGPGGGGGWIFTDVTATLGVHAFGRTSSAAYGDYDGDGWLDLYVGNHSYPKGPPQPGEPYHSDFLFHNIPGAGNSRTFEDVTHLLDPARLAVSIAHSVGFVDFDRDGDMDIYVVNEEDFSNTDPLNLTGENLLWVNGGSDGNGGWIFTEEAAANGLALKRHPMGLAIGDYNNDGWWDFAMTDVGPNHLLQNSGTGSCADVALAAGVQRSFVPGSGDTQWGWGVLFIDYDLDGYEDLYVGTGFLAQNNGQPNPLFHNQGNPPDCTFLEVTTGSGSATAQRTRCVLRGDYDGDGDEDLYAVNYDGFAHLYRNEQVGGDYLAVQLTGTRSSRDAIGAVARVSGAGIPDQWKLMQSGSTTGGGHGKTLHFGVTGATTVDLTIDWPSGEQTVMLGVGVNQLLQVVEPCPASWRTYGTGLPGTLGVPALTATADPVIGGSAGIAIGNSSGSASVGLLFVGLDQGFFPASWGGNLLVTPLWTVVLSLPGGGRTVTSTIPNDPTFCGQSIFLQVIQADSGAVRNLSMSAGLELLLGD